jgi:hypothetical protein
VEIAVSLLHGPKLPLPVAAASQKRPLAVRLR